MATGNPGNSFYRELGGAVDPLQVKAYLVMSELSPRTQYMVSPVVDVPCTLQPYPFWTQVEEKGAVTRFARLDRVYSMDFQELRRLNQYYIVLTSADLSPAAISAVKNALRLMMMQGTSSFDTSDAPKQFKLYSTTHGTSWTVLSTNVFHNATGMVLARSWTDHVIVTCMPKSKLLLHLEDGTPLLGADPSDVELRGARLTVEAILMGMPGPEIFLKVKVTVDPYPTMGEEEPINLSSDEQERPVSQLDGGARAGNPPRVVPSYMLERFQRARTAGFSESEVMSAMENCGVEDPVDWLQTQRRQLQYFRRKAHGQQVEEVPPGLTRRGKDLEKQTRRLMVEEELTWDQAWAAILLLQTRWKRYGRCDILAAVRQCGETPKLQDVMQTIRWSINKEPNIDVHGRQ